MFKHWVAKRSVVPVVACVLGAWGVVAARAEVADEHPWYVSLSAGAIDFEGDEPIDDAGLLSLRVGRDVSEAWSIEGALEYVPKLNETWRRDWRTGERISRLEEQAGVHDTTSARLSIEALWHVTRWERLDPFLAAGLGAAWYQDAFDGSVQAHGQAGAGCFYHLNDEWALRADFRAIAVPNGTEANSTYTVGLSWTPGERRAPPMPVPGKPGVAPLATAAPAGLSPSEEGATPEKADDVQFFELHLMFDPGDWKIKSEYYSEIGVIGKILKDNPAATARIEAHIDRTSEPAEREAVRLTERRAEAVRDYLTENWNIARGRLTPTGDGFSRPKSPADPQKGPLANDRIEVFIRKGAAPAPGG